MIPIQPAMPSSNPNAVASMAVVVTPRPRAGGIVAHQSVAAVELLHTLAETFPTISRILGEDAFLEVAAQFVAQHAPTAPASTYYGDCLPEFLRRIGATASAAYIADIAAIDAARSTARRISDRVAIPCSACDDLHGHRSARVVLHPSVVLLQSRFPAVTGWSVNQPRGDRWVRHWGSEDALIACTRLDAEVWRLPAGGFACLSSLKAGASLDDAARAGRQAAGTFDLADVLAVLTASNVVTDVRLPRRAAGRRIGVRPLSLLAQMRVATG